MKKIVLLLAILFLTVALANAAPVVLLDNLSLPSGGYFNGFTYKDRVAAPFGTDASNYSLSTVTLWMRMTPSGSMEADIYSDTDGRPGSLLQALTSPDLYPITFANVTFTSSGLSLSPSTTYWVVVKVLSGDLSWSFTDGSGAGYYQTTWGLSPDSGNIWAINGPGGPGMKMKVIAENNAVPIPGALLLFGSGLLSLAAWRRLSRKA